MRIHLYSLHGLFRAGNLEIGRDADNGGQIAYVMELAKALSRRPEVTHVHLFTRRVEDAALSSDYTRTIEPVNEKFDIRRIAFGGKKYLPKEQLWKHLDEFVTNAVTHIKAEKVFPDWIHSHYADAGYVASELSAILNVPFVHTGHSLGRPKLAKLLASGLPEEEALERFRFADRFAAEETTLLNSEFIVTSTAQEELSYEVYENSAHAEYHVIPPGLNFERYYPYYDEPQEADPDRLELRKQARFSVKQNLEKFFSHPDRPVILTICRPDKKKNIDGLIHAYGTDRELQAMANLAIFAGLRSDINAMPDGEKAVLTEILLLMDKYNLYGRLAIPKRHDVEWEVPEIYRLCATKNGAFVNIALNEPFGLTILEATACGLPVVATQDGGPSEIIPVCESGLLVPPTDTAEIQKALKTILTDPERWQRMSHTGIRRVREHYSWDHHVEVYLKLIAEYRADAGRATRKDVAPNPKLAERLKQAERMLISDIDDTMIDPKAGNPGLDDLIKLLHNRGNRFVYGLASGRSLELIQEVIKEHKLPPPDVVISGVGTCICYGVATKSGIDKGWLGHISYQWNPDLLRERLATMSALELQEPENQNDFKLSYYLHDPHVTAEVIRGVLGRPAGQVNVIITQQTYVDILPRRASKGRAIRYVANKWSIPIQQTIVCGDAGNDLDMFNGQTRGIVVANHSPELETLRGRRRVFFAGLPAAAGIMEGLRHHQFLETSP
jgi:sucrose-phosphate synthase